MAKILVVEDRKSLRTLYKLDLESEGHAVVTARNADEALRAIGSEPPELVVFEIGPPGKDGREAMERLIARLPETRVVLNSASSSDRILLPSPAPEACIVKSSDTRELRAKIRELLGSPSKVSDRREWMTAAMTPDSPTAAPIVAARLVTDDREVTAERAG